MSATNQAEQTAITLPQRAAVALGESANEARLRELAAKSIGIVTVTNADGREEAHRAGMVLLKMRTSIDRAAEVAVADAKEFVKAVGAKKVEMIGIIQPEEKRVLALRDGWDEKIAAEKAAKIAAERTRMDAIADAIAAIREDETDAIRICKTTDAVRETLAYCLARPITAEIFQERLAEAEELRATVAESIRAVLAEREASEAAAAAEAARLEAQRVELARVAAENERIANEQAAERQRLADLATAQALAAQQLADKAAANLKADRDAQELAMKREREKAAAEQAERDRVAADLKRQLDEQQAAIAAERKAMDDEREAAKAARELAAQVEADHAVALIDNAAFDAERAADLARCEQTAQAMLTNGRSLIASVEAYADAGLDDPELSDEEIAAMGAECGLEPMAWVERLEAFTARARAEMVAAA